MERTLIFFGGPSRSGKSRLSKAVSAATGVLHVDMDKVKSIRDLQSMQDGDEKFEALKQATATHIRSLSEDCVVEGSSLWPHSIKELNLESQITDLAFMGYPTISIEEKIAQLRECGLKDSNHLSQLSPERLRNKIGHYIERSQRQQEHCQAAGIECIDFSTWVNFDSERDKWSRKIQAYLAAK